MQFSANSDSVPTREVALINIIKIISKWVTARMVHAIN